MPIVTLEFQPVFTEAEEIRNRPSGTVSAYLTWKDLGVASLLIEFSAVHI
jgi:hypothetical protein